MAPAAPAPLAMVAAKAWWHLMAQSAIVAAGQQCRALASRSNLVAVAFFQAAAGGGDLLAGSSPWVCVWAAGIWVAWVWDAGVWAAGSGLGWADLVWRHRKAWVWDFSWALLWYWSYLLLVL